MQICVLYADMCTICRYVYYMQTRVLYAEVFLCLRVRYRGRPGNKAKVHVYYRVVTMTWQVLLCCGYCDQTMLQVPLPVFLNMCIK